MSQEHPILQNLVRAETRSLPDFRVGDIVRVHYRIREGEKERIQVFQGTVIRNARGGLGASFAVRKVSFGVGVERIFPTNSPRIEKVEIVSNSKVRRSRLYYLRNLSGKKARLKDGARASETPAAPTSDAPASN